MERSGSAGSSGDTRSFGDSGSFGDTGNGSGSGRAAPPGGAGRALLRLALLLLLLPPAWALPTAVRPLPTAVRPLPTAVRPLPTAVRPLPTPDQHPHHPSQRLRRSRELLEAANASLHRLKELNSLGFECTLEEVDLVDITENQINTIKACTAEDPGPGNCPALDESTFDEGKCLQGISADLRAYRAELSKLQDPQVLEALDAMMEAVGNSTGNALEAPVGSLLGSGSILGSELESFSARLRLCRVLQAFLIRSLTISRMMNFLSSLEIPGIHPES